MRRSRLPLAAALLCCSAFAARLTTPHEALGFNIGDDYQVANYTQLEAYWKKLAGESDRMRLVDIGKTGEGRTQYMAVISSSANIRNLARFKSIAQRLAHAEGISEGEARQLARDGKAVVWIDGGLHANETVGSQQLIETVYQLVSRTDEETLRLLDNDIVLCVQANPDGQQIVSDWYMREKDPLKRSMNNLPRLYSKYAGHDDNRDFYMSNLPETTNMNRQLFMEWFPQIVYNHHQTGPAGAVIFMPPFRDPFNYNLDPLVPLGVELVGTAMHSRLVAEGKGGSAMRSAANYSTWWNGGLRTVTYFHNMIGLLTEIIGNPTPIDIPLVAAKQLPSGDWPMPIAPGKWHYRQSIDYEISNNYAVLDVAARYRETFLFNIWRMGMNSIEKGSRDSWTVTPKRVEALKAAAPGRAAPEELYAKILHDPLKRDARGYIIPADQPDFATAAKFVDALLKNGIEVLRATQRFEVAGHIYPAESFVVKTAQAFRPHILDMFEPQDHPNDVRYPGGPPVPPYDIAGWTLAMQMGVQFERVLEGFNGPFARVVDARVPRGEISGLSAPAGWIVSHKLNDSFMLTNRLLKAKCEVFWQQGSGDLWIPATPASRRILEGSGLRAEGRASAPGGTGLKLKSTRVALYEPYGGLMTAGWTRFLFDGFEFAYEVVQSVEDLKSRFDVLVLTDGARVNAALPQLRRFVESGGAIVSIGDSTAIGGMMGLPVANHLAGLTDEKFFIPGSLMKVSVDTTNPLAYGMAETAYVFFDRSPVFRLAPDAAKRNAAAVAWFGPGDALASGWAWGQQNLAGGTAVVDARVGEGKVFLFGPEIAFRAQPHGTFKFLFNALFYATAQQVRIE